MSSLNICNDYYLYSQQDNVSGIFNYNSMISIFELIGDCHCSSLRYGVRFHVKDRRYISYHFFYGIWNIAKTSLHYILDIYAIVSYFMVY